MSNYTANVVVHIDETLTASEIHDMERDLAFEEGVYSACVNDRTPHLMVIDYDPLETQSLKLLHTVQDHGCHAELIGF